MRSRAFDQVGRRVLLCGFLALLLAGCQGKPASTSSGSDIAIPDQEARDFTLTESSEGKKSWTLYASYAAMYNDRGLVDARTVRIDFFNAKGDRYSTLTADQGKVFQRTDNLEARGRVKITTASGVTLETDSLQWINTRSRIVSDAFVRVTRKGDVVTGTGFESDASLDHFHLSHQVQAEVREQAGADSLP
jgi:LPS export ABC transporter protein LptC